MIRMTTKVQKDHLGYSQIEPHGGNQMKTTKTVLIVVAAALVSLALSACSIEIDRNLDGSLRLEVNLPETTIQDEISAALDDPLISELQADLDGGSIQIAAQRKRPGADVLDQITFQLNLGVSDGHLTALVSEAMLNDWPLDESTVSTWNERLGTKLERAARRNPNAKLETVTVSDEAVDFIWRIETDRSRGE
jgi:hypothetical protein